MLLSLGSRPCSQVVMFIHASKLACLNLPTFLVCPLADGKPQNKIAAVGSTKRLPWSHNDILRLVKAPPLSSSVLPSRQQYRMWDYPGTPPPSVYQVTHGTAFQAAERLRFLFLPRIRRIERISLRILGARQKHQKPLAIDA